MWRALVKGLDSPDITYCIYITFTFMHLADAFIQSDLHCIQITVFLHLTSSYYCDTFPPANSIESAVRRVCSFEPMTHQICLQIVQMPCLCAATWASWHVQGDALHLSDNISSWLHCGAQMAASARWNGALPVIPVENVLSWCDRIKAIGWLCLACYVIVVSQDSLQWLMKRSIWAKEK